MELIEIGTELELGLIDNWISWGEDIYELDVGIYEYEDLIDLINEAQPDYYLTAEASGPGYVTTLTPSTPDAWTLAAGPGILYFLGLDNKTSDPNNGGAGNPIKVSGDRAPAILNCYLLREFGLLPGYYGADSYRESGAVMCGSGYELDEVILYLPDTEDEGHLCRWADQAAGGYIQIEGERYYLVDDAVVPEREADKLRLQLSLRLVEE